MRRLVIGSRGSRLALWQAHHVRDRLLAAQPGLEVDVLVIRTAGDAHGQAPLQAVTQRGFFSTEIQQALLAGRIDLAVHSLKDLPVEPEAGLVIAAIPPRDDPSDALVAKGGGRLADLPAGAKVLCSSWRRQAQLLARRADLRIEPVRGNVDTRLRKLDESAADAIVLASAGLDRLGEGGRISERLDPADFLPAPGQGALAVEARADDADVIGVVAGLEHGPTRLATQAERAFLAGLGGGCQLPAGAYGRIDAGALVLTGLVASRDGRQVVRDEVRTDDPSEAAALGADLARRLLEAGGRKILIQLEQA